MTFLKTREPAEIETSVETEVEGEIREFVRRDVVGVRRQPESDSELVANNINQLLQRVAGTSVQEIDKLITELQTLRDTLQSEAARVQREIVEYATLSQAALQSTTIIAESRGHPRVGGGGRKGGRERAAQEAGSQSGEPKVRWKGNRGVRRKTGPAPSPPSWGGEGGGR